MDRDRAIVTLQLPEARSDGVKGLWKNSTIAARSSRDRAAIEGIRARDRSGLVSFRSASDRRS